MGLTPRVAIADLVALAKVALVRVAFLELGEGEGEDEGECERESVGVRMDARVSQGGRRGEGGPKVVRSVSASVRSA